MYVARPIAKHLYPQVCNLTWLGHDSRKGHLTVGDVKKTGRGSRKNCFLFSKWQVPRLVFFILLIVGMAFSNVNTFWEFSFTLVGFC
jgi:hypothetical protein